VAGTTNIKARIIGTSKVLRDAIARLERVARVHAVSVLIEGETGTGKELAAQLVHERSRRHGRFLAINCAAIPKDLVESELFGYARGAFSGAHREHAGLFEQANGGTLFLDEVGELPLALQAKVLRAVQEGEVRRVGSSDVRKVDVRIVAATHRDLRAMADAGEFREDLLYRLRGYVVHLPPLRARGRDVLLLARRFLEETFRSKRFSREAEVLLLDYPWPGNIRELQNVVRAAAIDARRTIGPEHLVPHMDVEPPDSDGAPGSRTDAILEVIDETGSASPAELRDATGLTQTTLRRAINDMLAAGIVERLGEGRHVRYARAAARDDDARPKLTPRQRLIIRHVENAGRITRQECAETTGASLRTASRDLSELVRNGLLVPDGRPGKAAGYVLARPSSSQTTGPQCPSPTPPARPAQPA
jgi:transcriptional regulator with GAF, ATPase, and Fis domain